MILTLYQDDQRRIEIPADFLQALGVEIQASESVEIWALPGHLNQLQLLPLDSQLSRIRGSYRGSTAPAYDIPAAAVAAHRNLNAIIPITCRRRSRGSRVRLTLPAITFDLDLFRPEDRIVVFCEGQLFELWNHRAWNEATRIADINAFVRSASQITELEEV